MSPLRFLLGLCCALALCTPLLAADQTVSFDGQTLHLAFQDDQPSVRLKEYIAKGQTLQNWTRLAGVFEYPKNDDVKAMVETIASLVKKQNPDAQSSIVENKATGDMIIDFVTWPADRSYVEFDIFHFWKNEKGSLSAQQYALREYQDTSGFLKKLKPLRVRLVEAMAKGEFKMSGQ